MELPRFMVRVYALIVHERHLLLSDECYQAQHFTKFPGGGLEFGESPPQCLAREIREELNVALAGYEHFYTTDFLQYSAFHNKTQLINIYYLARVNNPEIIKATYTVEPNYPKSQNEYYFRWVNTDYLQKEMLTFPMDKHVAGLFLSSLSLNKVFI
ncbi:MAG: NUDIX domain-containing protein [Candidatus Competibacteraceae bacterium]|nr:NUDIX domain-containing protein [Candidatus Competibacteraceae bacterium]